MTDSMRAFLEELVDEYREGLMFYIYRTVKNMETAEDLAEDVFVELILHPDRYDPARKASIKTYLYTIGRNKAVDHLRKNARIAYAEPETMEEMQDLRTLEEAVIDSEEKQALYAAMKTLRSEYRDALHLVFFEDLSYREAGKIMGKSEKQIENLVYRAKKSLAKQLGGAGFEK